MADVAVRAQAGFNGEAGVNGEVTVQPTNKSVGMAVPSLVARPLMPPSRRRDASPKGEEADSSISLGPRPAKSKRRLMIGFGCLCCGPRVVGQAWLELQIGEQKPLSLAAAAAAADGCQAAPYVDTHCHLDMVLKLHKRRVTVPSTCKPWKHLSAEELLLWRLLGWSSEQWHSRDIIGNPIWSRAWARLSPAELSAASALGWDAVQWDSQHWLLPHVEWEELPGEQRCHLVVLGESAETWPNILKSNRKRYVKRNKGNPIWYRPWMQLTSAQHAAVEALGWDPVKWDGCWWLLPYQEWSKLSGEIRSHLAVLGETAESWEVILQSKIQQRSPDKIRNNSIWQRSWADLHAAEQAAASALGWSPSQWNSHAWILPDLDWPELDEEMRGHLSVLGESETSWPANLTAPRTAAGYGGDWRQWADLSPRERETACKLGFSGPVWNMADMSDLQVLLSQFCGSGFEGCVAQGCDLDSIDDTVQLALAHPLVFAAFGCHPKTAWEYDESFEARLLDAFSACEKKVVAWGECGLDYSSAIWGRRDDYRQKQREVFRRQVQLAIERGLPLVLHVRDASDDALLVIRECVPRHWKVHMHSFLGDTAVVDKLINEYPHAYFGLTGTVTMGGGGEKVCHALPLSRILLETDSPCIEPRGVPFSHPGQIPLIARKVAALRGWDPKDVLLTARENARFFYGI